VYRVRSQAARPAEDRGCASAGFGTGAALGVHTTLGIPSPTSTSDPDSYLSVKAEYVVSYDEAGRRQDETGRRQDETGRRQDEAGRRQDETVTACRAGPGIARWWW
jgi:hypothetical protein